MKRAARLSAWLLAALLGATSAAAQSDDPGTTYRVFLKDGRALPSYGEAVRVADRIVFNLLVRSGSSGVDLQLMSLPITSVDADRTERYLQTMRAARYAATRGEIDYAAMTAEMNSTLQRLSSTTDKRQQLVLIEQTFRRLAGWPEQTFHYREKDIQELVTLFDEISTELRIALGERTFALDLVAGASPPARETLLGAPTLRESAGAALAASDVADVPEERMAILRMAAATVGDDPGVADLRDAIDRRLVDEARTNAAYAALTREVRALSDAARRNGDVGALRRLADTLPDRDRQLGSRRPQDVAVLVQTLRETLAATEVHRLALDHYALMRPNMLKYEREIRPALSGLESMASLLESIRDLRRIAFSRVEASLARVKTLVTLAERTTPPDDVAGVHSTLVSALRMAREACERRRRAVVTNRIQIDREASSAAAGALLLGAEARRNLVTSLYPPKMN